MTTTGTPLRRAIETHLGSRDVARVIYGAVIGLALVVALEQHPPSAAKTASFLVGTAIAVGLAEVYSEYVGAEARTRRHPDGTQVRQLIADAGAVALGAGVPAIFFVVAAAGAMDTDLAFTLAKWSGLGLLCVYGFLAGRLAGEGVVAAVAHAALVGLIGGALIALKALLH